MQTEAMTDCSVYRLGTVDYLEAWHYQKDLAGARGRGVINDSLLLLEHPHTYTLGSSGSFDHLLMDEAERAERGVAVYQVDRGGDITYHGPGQLVGYPILQLATSHDGLKVGVVDYIRQLEECLMDVLAEFDVASQQLKEYTGVWVPVNGVLHKIAAIGVKVTGRAVTMHGFALNINTDMTYFNGIIPCGISDKPVVSLAQLLGEDIPMHFVMDLVEQSFSATFGRNLIATDPLALDINHS